MDGVFLSDSAVSGRVEREFGNLPFPLLNVAMRKLDDILFERVARDPARVSNEMAEYDRQREEALRG